MIKTIKLFLYIFLIQKTIPTGYLINNVIKMAQRPQFQKVAINLIKDGPKNIKPQNIVKPQNIIKPQNLQKNLKPQNLAKNLKNNNKVFEPFIRRNFNNQPLHKNMFQKNHYKAENLNGNGIPKVEGLINNFGKGKMKEMLVEQSRNGENLYEQMMNKRIEMMNEKDLGNKGNLANEGNLANKGHLNNLKNDKDLVLEKKGNLKNDKDLVLEKKGNLKNDKDLILEKEGNLENDKNLVLEKEGNLENDRNFNFREKDPEKRIDILEDVDEIGKIEEELEMVNDFVINPRNPAELIEPNLINEINKTDLLTLSQESKLVNNMQIKEYSENILKNPNFEFLNSNNLRNNFVNPLLQNPHHLMFLKNLNQNPETQNIMNKILNIDINKNKPENILNNKDLQILENDKKNLVILNEQKNLINLPKEELGIANLNSEQTDLSIIKNDPKNLINLPKEEKGISIIKNQEKRILNFPKIDFTLLSDKKFIKYGAKSDYSNINNNPLFNKDLLKKQPQFLSSQKMNDLRYKFEFLNEIDDLDKKLDMKQIKLSENNDLLKNLGMDKEMMKKVKNFKNLDISEKTKILNNPVTNLENSPKIESKIDSFKNSENKKDILQNKEIFKNQINNPLIKNFSRNNYLPMMYSMYNGSLINPLLSKKFFDQNLKRNQDLNIEKNNGNQIPIQNPNLDLGKDFVNFNNHDKIGFGNKINFDEVAKNSEKINISKIFAQNPNILSLPKVEDYFLKNYEKNSLYNFKEKKIDNFEEIKNKSKMTTSLNNIYGFNFELYPNYMQDILKENPKIYDRQNFRKFIKIQKILEEEKNNNFPKKNDFKKFSKISSNLKKMQMLKAENPEKAKNTQNYEKKIKKINSEKFENSWKFFLKKKAEIPEKIDFQKKAEFPEKTEISEKIQKIKMEDKIFSKMMDLPFYNFILDLEELCIDQFELFLCRKLMTLLNDFYLPLKLEKRRNFVFVKIEVERILANEGFEEFLQELRNLDLLDSLALTFAKVYGRVEYLVFEFVQDENDVM